MADLSLAFPEVTAPSKADGAACLRRRAEAEPAPSEPPLAETFAEALAETARMKSWAEAIRSSELGGSFMVLRPAPAWPQTDYPSAAAAYGELARVVSEL